MPLPTASPLPLRAERLHVRLGGHAMLRAVSMAAEPGALTVLLGPNGSGKTTLLRALSGLVPYDGSVLLGGRDLGAWRRTALARARAYVEQSPSLAFGFTALDVALLGRVPHGGRLGGPQADDLPRALGALDAVGMGWARDRSVQALSGGEQRRVALARALAQDAPLLLLDEPTAHLDVRHALDFLGVLRQQAERGRTVVAALHDLDRAGHLADHVVLLEAGSVVASGSPRAVLTPERIRQVYGVEATVRAKGDRVRVEIGEPA